MFKPWNLISALIIGCGLVSCNGGGEKAAGTTGKVNFGLQIPEGHSVDTIELSLSCPGSNVQQTHLLNVVKRDVVAAFGGLAPGTCTVALRTQTSKGSECNGNKAFTVVANQTADVVVVLTCQGENRSADGNAKLSTKFNHRPCSADRIKKVYTLDSRMTLGGRSLIDVEVNDSAVVGTPKYSWALRNDAAHRATGKLEAGLCSPSSASCQTFTCTDLGARPGTDPDSGLLLASVYVTVTYEDDDCFDTEEVEVDCLVSYLCGDGNTQGEETCDDANVVNEDGCSASCQLEFCGDGIVQTGLGETCDVAVPSTSPNVICTPDCKTLIIDPPFCGDGEKNTPAEQCDGNSGLMPGQECDPTTCMIIPICGNGIKEASEECDEPSPSCIVCRRVGIGGCNQCISQIPDVGAYKATHCDTNKDCQAILSCILENRRCWSEVGPWSCYCGGNTDADFDACHRPAFVPTGACSAPMRAGAGPGATNEQVLNRYFDLEYPLGVATVISDAAYTGCNHVCF